MSCLIASTVTGFFWSCVSFGRLVSWTIITFRYTCGKPLGHRRRSFWDPIGCLWPWPPCHRQLRNPEYPRTAWTREKDSLKNSHFPQYLYLLSGFECQFVILSPIGTIDLGKVESLWEKVMDERAKSDAIGPGGGKILNFNVLNYGIKMSSFLFTR